MKFRLTVVSHAALIVFLYDQYLSSLAQTACLIVPTAEALLYTHHAFASRGRLVKQQRDVSVNLSRCDGVPDLESNRISSEETKNDSTTYTTAVLKLAYDGTYFRGFTASNAEPNNNGARNKGGGEDIIARSATTKRRQSRRSRTLQRKGGKNGSIRTVEVALRLVLAKIYGNVHPSQIKMECCSRTDAGVHATSLIAQFYCLRNTTAHDIKTNSTKSIPIRPNSCDDVSNFLPLPFNSDLSKLVFVLNRMLPPDVRAVAASPPPYVTPSTPSRGGSTTTDGGSTAAFHPTLHTMSKTYTYQFALGPIHDPLQTHYVWHLDGSSARAIGMNGKKFSLERALLAADLFVDSHDENMNIDTALPRDFGAFRSAFRGTDRGRIQSTICKLWRCEILRERKELLPSWETDDDVLGEGDMVKSTEMHMREGSRLGKTALGSRVDSFDLIENPQTFTVVVTGDRFLYKMIRNIVGTIVAVACGHLDLDEVRVALDTGQWGGKQINEEDANEGRGETTRKIMSSCSESNVQTQTIRRICAPPRGLTLIEVTYPTDVHFHWQSG
ncbi:hypothetical protein ACHAXR_001974 [Thalassiosira sp. AJA248-18]